MAVDGGGVIRSVRGNAVGASTASTACGDTAAVGDMVLVRGKLAADRDLGFNYKFDLLIEDATVTIE